MSSRAVDTGSNSVTSNGGVAATPDNLKTRPLIKEDQEMKPLKSSKEVKERTDHESDNVNDGVSFLLEEPRSCLKKGFNIEVFWFLVKKGDIQLSIIWFVKVI